MRIGIDVRLTHYRTGGISTYMRRLVMALEALDSGNEYIELHSRKSREKFTRRMGAARLWTPCHHRWERLALSVELAPLRLGLLHSPDFIPPLRGARRHVITVHDLTFLHYPQFVTAEARRYYNGQIEAAVRQADHILVDSAATQRDLMEMLNVQAENITVHLLGVDERFQPMAAEERAAWKEKLDLPEGFILFVGTIEPRKNISGLLAAYRMLRDRMADAPPLVLVGRRGWLYEDTLRDIARLDLSRQVIWREDVPDAALPAVYNLASVLVMPSFYEGFGFPALEAMACGTVPVVSNRSSLPEVVGEVGLQVEPEDAAALAEALEKALTDAPWREQMRQAGLARSREFTWASTAEIVLQVYRHLGAN